MASLTVDKRILHVANPYVEYENASPAQIMKQAHDRIREKFYRTAIGEDSKGAGSIAEAQKLNEFFQAIKIYQNEPDSNFLDPVKKQIIQNIISSALKIRKSLQPKETVAQNSKRFLRWDRGTGQERGKAAEQDIAIIMQSVFDELSGSQGNYQNLILGDAYVNVSNGPTLNPKSLDNLAKAMTQAGAKKIYNQVLQGSKDRFTQVQGKIDITGINATVTFDINANPYLIEIGELLNKASFSIKSYSSVSFDKELKQRLESKVTKLHLGHTDQRRIFVDLFSQLGIPNHVSLSMLYYVKKTKNKSIKKQASDLIFVYELTGYGQKYVNKAIQEVLDDLGVDGANYFIYNDPSTDRIYVRSTAELIMTMWGHVDDLLEKGATSLQKSLFYST